MRLALPRVLSHRLRDARATPRSTSARRVRVGPASAALLALLGLGGVGCTDTGGEDSAPPVVEDEAPTGLECDVLDIRVTGNDPPHVGDAWTLWLWCDDTLLTGAMRLSFDPNDIATVSQNNAEFLHAGEATVTVQVGSRRQTREVTVLE